MSQYACWIEPAIINEWSSLMQAYDLKNQKVRPLEEYLRHLSWFDPERNTREVRAIIENMRAKGNSVFCVWSGKRLRSKFEVDHCLPFAHWPNNDLWNLMPAHPNSSVISFSEDGYRRISPTISQINKNFFIQSALKIRLL
jgi:hypothetical protein